MAAHHRPCRRRFAARAERAYGADPGLRQLDPGYRLFAVERVGTEADLVRIGEPVAVGVAGAPDVVAAEIAQHGFDGIARAIAVIVAGAVCHGRMRIQGIRGERNLARIRHAVAVPIGRRVDIGERPRLDDVRHAVGIAVRRGGAQRVQAERDFHDVRVAVAIEIAACGERRDADALEPGRHRVGRAVTRVAGTVRGRRVGRGRRGGQRQLEPVRQAVAVEIARIVARIAGVGDGYPLREVGESLYVVRGTATVGVQEAAGIAGIGAVGRLDRVGHEIAVRIAAGIDAAAAIICRVEIIGDVVAVEVGRLRRGVAVAVAVRVLLPGRYPVAVVVRVEVVRGAVIVGVLRRRVFGGGRYAVVIVVGILVVRRGVGVGIAALADVGTLVSALQAVAVVVASGIVVRDGNAGARRLADRQARIIGAGERDLDGFLVLQQVVVEGLQRD